MASKRPTTKVEKEQMNGFFSAERHARGRANHVVLLYAHFVEALGILRGKKLRLGGLGKIGVENDDIRMRGAQLREPFAE